MSFELSVEMNDEFVNGCDSSAEETTKPFDVITIDDDEEEDEEYDDDIVEEDDEFGSDEIQILEVITRKTSNELNTDLSPIGTKGTELSAEELDRRLNESCNTCLQTINTNDLNENHSDIESRVESRAETKSAIKTSPKRIIPLSLSTSASTSRLPVDDNQHKEETTGDPPPNKLMRTEGPNEELNEEPNDGSNEAPNEEPMPSVSAPKLDSETLYQNYLKALRYRLNELEVNVSQIEDMVKKLDDIYAKVKENNKKFLKSKQFPKLMETFTIEVTEIENESRVVSHNNDLIRELNRLALKVKESTEKVENKSNKIKKLTKTLKNIQKSIFAAENEELDYEAMERNTSFTDLPKLYRKAEEVWRKREELLNRSTHSGRILFKRLRYDSTEYPEVNKCAEKLFNNHMKRLKNKTTKGYVDESFTYIDVRKAILDEIQSKQLVVMNSDAMIATVYRDLLTELRERRKKDSEEVFETLESLEDLKPETFVENDPQIEIELEKNKSYYGRKMDELFQKYTIEDRKKNGESVLTDNRCEWESPLLESEEFDLMDVKDGDLEEEDNEEDNEEDDVSDEEIKEIFGAIPVPDFAIIQSEPAPAVQAEAPAQATEAPPQPTVTTSAVTSEENCSADVANG